MDMRRREFIAGLGGTAVMGPRGACGQSPIPVVGFLNNGSETAFSELARSFHKGLADTGYLIGQNVVIEHRWAEGDNGRLPALVADLVQRGSAVIAATGGTASPIAAQKATTTIPVVFAIGADPVKFGLVASLNRPGGNMTGVSFLANSLLAKQVEVLHEIVGKDAVLGFLVNPTNPNAASDTQQVVSAALLLNHKVITERAESRSEIERAFTALTAQHITALLIFPDALFTSYRSQIVELAALHKLPTLYNSAFAVAGGLVGYGAKQSEAYRNAGIYVGRILKGDKPQDLPVMQSSSVELIVNLKTAKALGIEIPQTILARADEIIE
jgi:putative ABC transport system substrate-binding protein